MKKNEYGGFFRHLSKHQLVLLNKCERLREAGLPINLMVYCPGCHDEVQEFLICYQMWLALTWNPKHIFTICTDREEHKDECIDTMNDVVKHYNTKSFGVQGQLKMSLIPKTSEYIFRDTANNKQIRNNRIRIGSAQEPDNLRGLPGTGALFFNICTWPDSPKARAEDLVKSIAGGVLPRPYTMQVFTTQRLFRGSFAREFYCDSKEGLTGFVPIDIYPDYQ